MVQYEVQETTIVNGLEDENVGQMVDEYGTRWSPIVRQYDTNW